MQGLSQRETVERRSQQCCKGSHWFYLANTNKQKTLIENIAREKYENKYDGIHKATLLIIKISSEVQKSQVNRLEK